MLPGRDAHIDLEPAPPASLLPRKVKGGGEAGQNKEEEELKERGGSENGENRVESEDPTQAPKEDLQPLSFDEQEALSESINLLPERLLPGAMQIIRESVIVNDDDDEIDLDIDQLDTKTQRKLQKFVMQVRLATMP